MKASTGQAKERAQFIVEFVRLACKDAANSLRQFTSLIKGTAAMPRTMIGSKAQMYCHDLEMVPPVHCCRGATEPWRSKSSMKSDSSLMVASALFLAELDLRRRASVSRDLSTVLSSSTKLKLEQMSRMPLHEACL